MKLLFENKRCIVSIFLTSLMVFCTLISGYADENSAPVFIDGNRATRTIAENTAAGVNIGKPIAATDADGDTLTYNKGWLDGAAFSIDTATGQIRTKAPLDYETKNVYHFNVFVDDGNGGRDVILVTINVTDVDETSANNAPSFTDGDTTTRTVAENTASGTNIGAAIAATDADDDTLTYTLGGTDASSFTIVSTSGQLQRRAALDYETKSSYSVSVSVSDGNGGSDSIAVTIGVTDVNETPSFATETATLSIAENTASGTNIGDAFQATDPDSGDTLTYSLHRGDAGVFRINASTGQLRTHGALDFETKKVYNNLAIRATDSKGNFDAIFVTVNVTDVNETPSFPTETATLSIAENTASGTNIGAPFQATDPDSGDTLTYSLHRGDAASFRINATTGQLRTHAALDFETKKVYNNLAIRATDSKGNFDAIFVTINVTDVNENRAPTFSEGDSTTRSIAENTASGVNIGSAISAADPDTGDTLTYTLGGTDAASFSIVSTSGQLQTNAALDYETKASYAVSVSVSDGNGGSDSITVTINVTDVNENRAPAFTDGTNTTRSIAENTASGVNIGSAISAADPDTGDTLTYTLGGTDAASFSIVSTSGQLQTNAALDYETKASYAVSVSVSDGNGGSDTIAVTVNVTDVNENRAPAFTDGANTTRSIAENAASGVNIGSAVSATDPDTDDTLTYSLGGTDASSFSIVSTSGQLQTNAALDYETKTSYAVSVSVSDGNGESDNITVTISVQDVNEAPSFPANRATRAIAENTAAGQAFGDPFQATDPDSGDTLTYSLHRGDRHSFRIDPNTGQLRTYAALDFETKNVYNDLAVRATDSEGSFDVILVTINVTDVDENRAPAFTDGASTTRSIAENTASGVNIGTAIAATDADTDDTLTYTLGGTDASAFSIVSTSGQLQTNVALDYETKASYSVSVSVSDGNGGNDSISVTVNVTDVDENRAPVFTDGSSTTRGVNETTNVISIKVGAAIAATDADGDTLTYTLGGTDADSFTIDSTSGQLRASVVLMYARKSSYSVTVSVSDGNGGSDSITVTINVVKRIMTGTPAVRDAIVAAANVRSYREVTPAHLRNISALNVVRKSMSSLQAGDFNGLTNLTKLDLSFNSLTDISHLSGLTNLKQLNLRNNSISDISALSGMTKLETLYLMQNSISDISALSGMTQLKNLSLAANSISNISVLSNKTNLRELFLGGNSISDISALSGLTNLVNLSLGSNSISDISHLSGLTNLTSLSLGRNSISDVSHLKTLTSLTSLYLGHNNISDISELSTLTNLYVLSLSGNENLSDVSTLNTLTNLANLSLGGSSLSDISSLTNLNLYGFILDGSSVSDISVLSNWTNLIDLRMWDNENLSNISTLGSLTNLTTLYLSHNNISDVSPLSSLTSLNVFELRGNPIPHSQYATMRAFTYPPADIDLDNEPPVFTDGASATRSVAENTAAGTNFGAVVAATDTESDTLTYSLGGPDADSFSIVSTSGQLQTKAALDFETKNSYTVTVSVSGDRPNNEILDRYGNITDYKAPSKGLDRITVTINVTDVAGQAPSVETLPVLPEMTALLSNFPNPFNPETWIPYQLAKPADVTLTIYDIRGRIVRTLRLGHQPAGMYRSHSKAAYWDGRNQFGEKVATGIYFYTLKAGDYTATRKLLIRK